MSEEKKAIDYLKNDVVYWLDKGKDFVVIDIGENEKLHTLLNLIEKQQKEIEELKEKDTHITKETVEFVNSHYISKDKIRELLKSKDIELTGVISYRELEELLEEDDGDHIPRID